MGAANALTAGRESSTIDIPGLWLSSRHRQRAAGRTMIVRTICEFYHYAREERWNPC